MVRRQELPPLSAAQREIMEIVWDLGEVSASEVCAILRKRRPVARNTVRTLMERMEDKGWLTHRAKGRTHRYSAVHDRRKTMGQIILQVLDQVCGGSPETLMAALLEHRGLKSAELARIEALLAAARSQKHPRGEQR